MSVKIRYLVVWALIVGLVAGCTAAPAAPLESGGAAPGLPVSADPTAPAIPPSPAPTEAPTALPAVEATVMPTAIPPEAEAAAEAGPVAIQGLASDHGAHRVRSATTMYSEMTYTCHVGWTRVSALEGDIQGDWSSEWHSVHPVGCTIYPDEAVVDSEGIVEGTVLGRTGTFQDVCHGGWHTTDPSPTDHTRDRVLELDCEILSGTGELAGIRGAYSVQITYHPADAFLGQGAYSGQVTFGTAEEQEDLAAEEPAAPAGPSIDLERTLNSFEQVDDYPLYVMHVYGDHGFDAILEERRAALQGVAQAPTAFAGPTGDACTVFAALHPDGEPLLARNLDWSSYWPAMVIFTHPPEGYDSVALTTWPIVATDPLATVHVPFEGMNSAGLAISWTNAGAELPPQDPDKVTLADNEVTRLVLDHAGNVPEALDLLSQYNIRWLNYTPGGIYGVHYMLADRQGNSVVVEWVDGEMKVIQEEGRPWHVAANFRLWDEESYGSSGFYPNYSTIEAALEETGGVLASDEAMALLNEASKDNTMWSATYNLQTGEVQVVMGRQWDTVHRFTLEMDEP